MVKSHLERMTMNDVGEVCGGLPRNYVFRSQLTSDERGEYAEVVPLGLRRLMLGLNIVFASGEQEAWLPSTIERIRDDPNLSPQKRVLLMAMLHVLDEQDI